MCRILILSLLVVLGGCKTARQLGRAEQEREDLRAQLLSRALVRDSVVHVPGDTIHVVHVLPAASGSGSVIERWNYVHDSTKVFQDNPTTAAQLIEARGDLAGAMARSLDLQAEVSQLRRREVTLWVVIVLAAFLLGIVIAVLVQVVFKI